MRTECLCDMKKSIRSKTKSEIISIALIVALIIIVIALGVLLAKPKDNVSEKTIPDGCRNQTCTKEALIILSRINADLDPCEDFFAFSCHGVEALLVKNLKYGPFADVVERFNAKLESKYGEEILPTDRSSIRTEKKMYAACMNESLEYEAFETLRDAIIFAGGWPVVEGSKWNEAKFDLFQASFTLRQLGFVHSTFLELNVVEDPKKKDGYILQVSIPQVDDVYSKFFNTDETNGFMADVANVFGAQVHKTLGEMTQTLEFLLDLQWIRTNIEQDGEEYERITINEAQSRHGSINWLNYVNQIARVSPKLTGDDHVLFPSENSLDKWLDTLAKAPKRLQANYLMWKVVEDNLPFVTAKLRSEKIKPKFLLAEEQTRSEFCIEVLRENFSPSPIDILYLRDVLSSKKLEQLRTLWKYFKLELKNVASQLTWVHDDEKKLVEEKVEEVETVFGAPGDYFNDDVLDRMNYSIPSGDFISMLAQIKKDNLDYLYSLLSQSPKETQLAWWKMSGDSSFHFITNKKIEISPAILQGFVFDEHRPNYLNFATVGLAMKNILYKLIGGSANWAKEVKCNLNDTSNYALHQILSHMVATKVSYLAYKSWVDDNGEEPSLYPLDYTSEQLFWISSGEIYCHYTDPIVSSKSDSRVIKEVIKNNSQTVQDFKCGLYIENKCALY